MTAPAVVCAGGEPPTCCQPSPMHPAFLSTRAYLLSLAPGDVPDRCPACSSQNIAPLFWPDASLDQYECFTCLRLFCWRD